MRIFEFVFPPSDVQPILEAGRKNIEASVRDEPGVLLMYCAVDKDDPNKLYVVEVYRDQAAYQAHVESAHFKAFLGAIQGENHFATGYGNLSSGSRRQDLQLARPLLARDGLVCQEWLITQPTRARAAIR
ncbi:putative quinol monooxygenase [Cupriavidus sp. CV2]|uniref:putative quinol monooxygenase n=1 Tax=Cupriavidus ulmosensis TaxID=3065913 RepID=UPI00296ABFCE|nr:putative quinol monooxygenase [Cupriavidus sp. CV2]MDW3682765.1 putative quinol monooxygenase [Cupriavidus sp. CV2]